jgi:hypothetical protein
MAAFHYQVIIDLSQCVERIYCLLLDSRSDFYQHSETTAWMFVVKVKIYPEERGHVFLGIHTTA